MRTWVLVVVAAMTGCVTGDGWSGEIEDVDGTSGPDPRELVTFRYQADWQHLDGMTVLFQDADSRIVSATTTNSAGVATAKMQPGGFVTLLLRNGQIFTYADVRGGDEIVVDARASATGERATVEVSLPQSPGADVYVLSSTCGESVLGEPVPDGPPVTATLFGCNGQTDVVVTTRDFEQAPIGGVWHYLYEPSVTIDPTTPIVLTGEYQPMVETYVRASGLAQTDEKLSVTQMLVRDQLRVTDPRGTTVTLAGEATATGTIGRMYVPKGGVTLTRVAPMATDALGMHATLTWGSSQEIVDVDLGQTRLRPFTSAPALGSDAREVTWTEGAGNPGDLVMVELAWRINNQAATWQVLAPRADATSVRLPRLPPNMLEVPSDARISQFATLDVSDDSRARTSLLGSWPGNDARFVESEAGRADIQTLVLGNVSK